ncbi:putative zinc finger in N-recognin-domain-containing protein [Aspergillus coremiiformis]|uniref:Putative zinc finger in N-recognin-domain-containing protein n=1 Tax=Aspergillus coremiiformis TaxID=138285 RepID=A0A5N6Z237_9EURO|nr:putative zinc finger in N-recognin-domain-containing protein [Aspergillus coremiiformis]
MDNSETTPSNADQAKNGSNVENRRESFSSQNSQTAKEFIESQMRLEADAREILPYSFASCTQALGPLRQTLYACLTCNPPPKTSDKPHTAAGVCYSCSIACHGEHTLVELFNKRNFVCDCGTTRMPSVVPCMLRHNPKTGAKGVHSEDPHPGNKYNQNFQNKFCGCGEDYNAEEEKGTMFQCLGLGTAESGGCGEDWWHPECLIGLPRDWYKDFKKETGENGQTEDDDETPLPPGFPGEDDFETFLCYKCVDSNPWLKRYAGTSGFLPPLYKDGGLPKPAETAPVTISSDVAEEQTTNPKKRKMEDEEESEPAAKRTKEDTENTPPDSKPESNAELKEEPTQPSPPKDKHDSLPGTAPSGTFSLFLKEDFRNHFCRCRDCFPNLSAHAQLREEEETYEPPLSEDGEANGGGSTGTGSLLDRGEAALSNIDRVRAIEGAMVYNHLRDKVKEFLKPFAETGKAVGAEDIKAYFEKLRGDEQHIRDASGQASTLSDKNDDNGNDGGSSRREQNGY